MSNIKDKMVFITGGTRGLGFSISKMLLNNGADVYTISDNDESIKNATEQLNNPKFHAFKCDVSDSSAVNEIANKLNRMDFVINNAGIWLEGSLTDNDVDYISKVIDVNVKGVIYVTKAFLPFMMESNSGTILNVSSTSGLVAKESQSVYVASKFAVTGFTESLKEDLKNTNIKVIGFYPGGMNTKLFEKAGFPKENSDWMNTDKVAEVVRFVLEQDDTMVIDHIVMKKRKTATTN